MVFDNVEFWQIKQRIRRYKKRHSRHYQKILAGQRTGKQPTKRTLQALENTLDWIEFWQDQLKAKEAQRKQKPVLEVA